MEGRRGHRAEEECECVFLFPGPPGRRGTALLASG